MTLDDARGVKDSLKGMVSELSAPMAAPPRRPSNKMAAGRARSARTAAVSARPASRMPEVNRAVAVGISKHGRRGYRIAVRVQRESLVQSDEVERIRRKAAGEVEVRFVGRIAKRQAASTPWYQRSNRPIAIGCSVGHWQITAGTLGCFVQDAAGMPYILSNNHVLANEDLARLGHSILQPGNLDGGRVRNSLIGRLGPWIKFKRRDNLVDAALAEIYDDITFFPDRLNGFPAGNRVLRAAAPDNAIDTNQRVRKVGRTTGYTEGRVTAFELDNVVVSYDRGNLSFDGQIEIEGAGNVPFSDGGDSGSVIVDSRNRPIGLLFAGGDTGGSNGLGLTYANPIGRVLTALNVDLLL